MPRLGQGRGMLLRDQLRFEGVEAVHCSLQSLELLIYQRGLQLTPADKMDLVVLDRESVYVKRLFRHRCGKQRQVYAFRQILPAEAAYVIAINAQNVTRACQP